MIKKKITIDPNEKQWENKSNSLFYKCLSIEVKYFVLFATFYPRKSFINVIFKQDLMVYEHHLYIFF